MNKKKLLAKVISGSKNVRFDDLITLANAFGFRLNRTSGSHHILEHPAMPELLNLQKRRGKVKPYQLRQFLHLIEQYNLQLGDDE